jgi:hypothetical protein
MEALGILPILQKRLQAFLASLQQDDQCHREPSFASFVSGLTR